LFPPVHRSDVLRVGVYLGVAGDGVENVEHVLRAWAEYLDGAVDLEAFGSARLSPETAERHTTVETPTRSVEGALSRIVAAYRDCCAYVRERSPDLVLQLWRYKTHAPGLTLAGRRTGTPVVTRYTGDTFAEYRQFSGARRAAIFTLDHVVGRIPLHLATGTIALGPYGREQLRERGVPADRVCVLPPPPTTDDRFSPPVDKAACKHGLDLPTDVPTFLYVGRVTRAKGMDFLAETIDAVLDRRDAQFLVVGEGPCRQQLEEHHGSAVRAVGHVPYDEIHDYYRAADAYVHPSAYEGLPLVVLEALECGLPVFARSPGDIALVTHHLGGTPDELAARLAGPPGWYEWQNRELFSESYQRETLVKQFRRVVG
jgi:glycosyltransferase involved in cell wall biosynthesis